MLNTALNTPQTTNALQWFLHAYHPHVFTAIPDFLGPQVVNTLEVIVKNLRGLSDKQFVLLAESAHKREDDYFGTLTGKEVHNVLMLFRRKMPSVS